MPTQVGDATWDITSLEPGDWEKWGGHSGPTGPPSPESGISAYGAGLFGYGREANVAQTPYSPRRRIRAALQMGARGGMQLQGQPSPMAAYTGGGMGAEGWGSGMIGGAAGEAGAARGPFGGIGALVKDAKAKGFGSPTEPNIRALLGGNQGAFDPYAQDFERYLLPLLEKDNAALERRDLLASDLESGDDPTLRAYAGLMSRLNASGRTAESLNAARFQHYNAVNDWLRNLYAQYIGGNPYEKKPKDYSWIAPAAQGVGQIAAAL